MPTDIINQQKFRQAVLFKGLREDPADLRTGTDIDFEYEDGKIWIKAEIKQAGKKIPAGQKILFTRFVDNIANYTAVSCILWHNAKSDEDIYIKDCYLVGYYWSRGRDKGWIRPKKPILFKTAFNYLVKTYGKG